jgi:predicted PurR-regulated permease PerM
MVTSKIISNGILRAVGILLGILVCLFFVYQIQTIIVYIVVSIILTLIANPIVEFLRKRLKLPNTFAVVLTVFLFVSLIVGFLFMVIPLIISQGENLSLLDTKAIENNILTLVNQIKIYLTSHHIDAEKLFKSTNITSQLDFNVVPLFLNKALGMLSGLGLGMASVFFITFFFLKDKVLFISGIKRIIPDEHEEKILNALEKTNQMLSRYFIGLLIQLTIVFILYFIVLLIFNVDNAFIIAFLCAILNIIPYVGPLIGSILAATLTMISNLGGDFQSEILPTTLYVMLGFWIVQVIDNNLSQPIIFSKSVNSHPLEIFIITIVSGFLFGITGMIIAIPFYTMIKITAKEFFPENKIVQTVTKNL